MLKKQSTAELLIGCCEDLDIWFSVEFEFDGEKSDVVATGWHIFNEHGETFQLETLPADAMIAIFDCLKEAVAKHKDDYYFALESAHYDSRAKILVPVDFDKD